MQFLVSLPPSSGYVSITSQNVSRRCLAFFLSLYGQLIKNNL